VNVLIWNVRGISSQSSGKIKRGRLRSNLRSMTPQPGIIMLQEHKVPETDCFNLGTLGLKRGKNFWNGGIYNADKNTWSVGTAMIIRVTRPEGHARGRRTAGRGRRSHGRPPWRPSAGGRRGRRPTAGAVLQGRPTEADRCPVRRGPSAIAVHRKPSTSAVHLGPSACVVRSL
jgi:hypothetical protein